MNKKKVIRATVPTLSELLGGLAFVAAVSFCDYLVIAFSVYRFHHPEVSFMQMLRSIADVLRWR